MLDENAATTSFPCVLVNSSSNDSVTSISEPAIDVGAVGEERKHPLRAELREAVQIEMLAVDRRLIDLEIAGMDDRARRRRDRERDAVGHAVGDADEFNRERANRDAIARADRLQSIAGLDLVLLELRFDEGQRHLRPVDRPVEQRHHMRHGADVILVRVGEHERLDLVAPSLDERQIGNDQIHSELIGIGKHDTGVDEDRCVLPRHRHHVHAELPEASEWDDLECRRRHIRYNRLIHQNPAPATSMLCPLYVRNPGGSVVNSVLMSLDATSDSSGGWERLSPSQPVVAEGVKPGRLNDFGEKS
jgi:hypothetical protein